jgi:hypothetical protein
LDEVDVLTTIAVVRGSVTLFNIILSPGDVPLVGFEVTSVVEGDVY